MADPDAPAAGPADATLFDDLMLASDASMIVVAATDGDEVDACLVGFHVQCSIEPLRYAVWLSKANHTYGIAARARVLAVHWLHPDDLDLAAAVGTVTIDDDPDKMQRVPWRRDGEAVRIDGAAGGFVGRIVHRHDDGDHECFVLEPFDAWHDASLRNGVLRFDRARALDAGHDAG